MTKIEIKEIKQKEPKGFFNVLVDNKTHFTVSLEQKSSLKYLVDFIAITQDNTPGDKKCEIVCESDELRNKIADMYEDLAGEGRAIAVAQDVLNARIYEMREQGDKILQTGLMTLTSAEVDFDDEIRLIEACVR